MNVILSLCILLNNPSVLDLKKEVGEANAKEYKSYRYVECFENEKTFNIRKTRILTGLYSGAGVSFLTALLSFSLMRKDSDSSEFRNICVNGKPCGNSCISWDEECHIDSSYSTRQISKSGWITGTAFSVLGISFIIAALIVPNKLTPKRINCNLQSCTMMFQF